MGQNFRPSPTLMHSKSYSEKYQQKSTYFLVVHDMLFVVQDVQFSNVSADSWCWRAASCWPEEHQHKKSRFVVCFDCWHGWPGRWAWKLQNCTDVSQETCIVHMQLAVTFVIDLSVDEVKGFQTSHHFDALRLLVIWHSTGVSMSEQFSENVACCPAGY